MSTVAPVAGEKRKQMDEGNSENSTNNDQSIVLKKQRTGDGNDQVLVTRNANQQALTIASDSAPPRTSSLQAATMQLTGHCAAIHSCRFSPSGSQIASGGNDKLLFLWDLATSGECTNTQTLAGHDAPILDIAWHGENEVLTASADKTAALWDIERGERIKRMRGHTSCVNSIDVTRRGTTLAVTGSDDCSIRGWDLRSRWPTFTITEHYQILATAFSDDGTQVFSAGISNDIKCWDVRTGKLFFDLIGHRDSVTGLSVSPDGSYLLSNSMDNTLRCWDIRPYVAAPTRLTMIYKGATHDLEQNLLRCAWSHDGLKVTGGSADKAVNVWEASSGRILYRLPGHTGSVNDVQFHPREPIILSCSSDKTMWLGEL